MKKYTGWLLAIFPFLWVTCTPSSTDEIPTPVAMYPVQFSVQLTKEIIPFPSLRSIPSAIIPEPETPSGGETDKELSDLCCRMDYLVYPAEKSGIPVKHVQLRENSDPDFGIVYDTLPAGKYRICFLTHSSDEVLLSGGKLAFGEVSDAFHGLLDITVDGTGVMQEDITLERIVSRIDFRATDTVPAGAGRVELEVHHLIPSVDPLTGAGDTFSETSAFTYTFGPEDIGKRNFVHSFFTFIPAGDEQLSVKITAYTQNGTVLRQQEVAGITPYKNKIVRYSGKLYHMPDHDETFHISVSGNGEWGGVEDNELPD